MKKERQRKREIRKKEKQGKSAGGGKLIDGEFNRQKSQVKKSPSQREGQEGDVDASTRHRR